MKESPILKIVRAKMGRQNVQSLTYANTLNGLQGKSNDICKIVQSNNLQGCCNLDPSKQKTLQNPNFFGFAGQDREAIDSEGFCGPESPLESATPSPAPVVGVDRRIISEFLDEKIQRFGQFLLLRAFLTRRAHCMEEWSDAVRMAHYIKNGLVSLRYIQIPAIQMPKFRRHREAVRAGMYSLRQPGRESDDHLWLKLTALYWLRSKGIEARPEVFYGPCNGDIVGGGWVVECGDTSPVRAEAIFHSNLTFVSLPYRRGVFSHKPFSAWAFRRTERATAA